VGYVTGPYEYRPDAAPGLRHTRKVDWKRQGLDRHELLRGDLRASIGSLLTISELRRFEAAKRLGEVAGGGSDPGNPEVPQDLRLLNGVEALADRVAAASAEKPVAMTVRAFLDIWGAVSRSGSAVRKILGDLADFGLSTVPPFTENPVEAEVRILPVGQAPEPDRHAKGQETALPELEAVEPQEAGPQALEAPALGIELDVESEVAEDSENEVVMPLGITVGRLPSARRSPRSVLPTDPLTAAVDLMTEYSYDQLAVIHADGRLFGAVAWREIGPSSAPRTPWSRTRP